MLLGDSDVFSFIGETEMICMSIFDRVLLCCNPPASALQLVRITGTPSIVRLAQELNLHPPHGFWPAVCVPPWLGPILQFIGTLQETASVS